MFDKLFAVCLLVDDFEKSLSVFSKQDVPHLFWAGYNWGNLVNLSKDDPETVADVSKAEALMRKVVDLDENYFYGGAHLFLGVFYGSRPQLLGGDFKKSKLKGQVKYKIDIFKDRIYS